MVLDEPKEEDTLFVLEGVTYVIDKTLYDRVKPIKVDYIQSPGGGGFFIFSNLGGTVGSGCG